MVAQGPWRPRKEWAVGIGHGAKRKAGDSRSRAPTGPKASAGSCHWIHWTADPWGPGSQPESRHPSCQAPGPALAPGRWRSPGSRWEPEGVQEAGKQLWRQPGTPGCRVRTEAPARQPAGPGSLTPRPHTCPAEARGAPAGVHPVPLHPLQEPHGRHGHFVVLLAKLQQVGEAWDVQAGVCADMRLSARPAQRPHPTPPSGPPSATLHHRGLRRHAPQHTPPRGPPLRPSTTGSPGPLPRNLQPLPQGGVLAATSPRLGGCQRLFELQGPAHLCAYWPTLLPAPFCLHVCLRPSACSLRGRQLLGDSAQRPLAGAPQASSALGRGFLGPPASETAAPATPLSGLASNYSGPAGRRAVRAGDAAHGGDRGQDCPRKPCSRGCWGRGQRKGQRAGWEAREAQEGLVSTLQPPQQQAEGTGPAVPPSVHGASVPELGLGVPRPSKRRHPKVRGQDSGTSP